MLTPIIDSNRRRRMSVTRLYLCGQSLWQIVAELGIDKTAVAHELTEIHKEWAADPHRGGTEAKARELARLDHMESEAWLAWERSQKDSTRVKKAEKKGENVLCETVTQTRDGDPRFLAAAQRAIDKRMAIFGFVRSRKSAADADEGVVNYTRFLGEVEKERSHKANETANQEPGHRDVF
ncbi:MAG TPA: hypothetical protein VMV69_18110 [Pirellulales bacterium]|nr:hypothetical protein [Pirellulales bacterium]